MRAKRAQNLKIVFVLQYQVQCRHDNNFQIVLI